MLVVRDGRTDEQIVHSIRETGTWGCEVFDCNGKIILHYFSDFLSDFGDIYKMSLFSGMFLGLFYTFQMSEVM